MAGELPRANGLRDEVLACSDTPRRSYILGLLLASIGQLPQAREAFLEVIARPDYQRYPDLEGPVTASLAIGCALLSRGDEAVEWARRALRIEGDPADCADSGQAGTRAGLADVRARRGGHRRARGRCRRRGSSRRPMKPSC